MEQQEQEQERQQLEQALQIVALHMAYAELPRSDSMSRWQQTDQGRNALNLLIERVREPRMSPIMTPPEIVPVADAPEVLEDASSNGSS